MEQAVLIVDGLTKPAQSLGKALDARHEGAQIGVVLEHGRAELDLVLIAPGAHGGLEVLVSDGPNQVLHLPSLDLVHLCS